MLNPTEINPKPPTVSVVIPVRNSAKVVGDCLDSVMKLDYPTFEVIVVDDASSDNTIETVSRYPVKLLSMKEKLGAYEARNRGVDVASGQIVAFTDSDCVVDPNWLRNLLSCYTDERIAGVGGRVLAFKSDGLLGIFQGLGPQEVFHSQKQVQLNSLNTSRFLVRGIGSGNMSFRLSALKELSGFSSDMIKCGEFELCWRVLNAGYSIIYTPEALTYHKPRSSILGIVQQFYQFGKSQPQLLKKEPDDYSYLELKSYLFPVRGFKRKLPVQMLVTIDFFNLAGLSLVLAFLNPTLLILFALFGLACVKQAWTKTETVTSLTMRAELLLLFPFLHALRSFAFSLGRFIGGLRNGILSF